MHMCGDWSSFGSTWLGQQGMKKQQNHRDPWLIHSDGDMPAAAQKLSVCYVQHEQGAHAVYSWPRKWVAWLIVCVRGLRLFSSVRKKLWFLHTLSTATLGPGKGLVILSLSQGSGSLTWQCSCQQYTLQTLLSTPAPVDVLCGGTQRERTSDSLERELKDLWATLHGCWKLNSGSPEDQ